jgi:hypothetical protein
MTTDEEIFVDRILWQFVFDVTVLHKILTKFVGRNSDISETVVRVSNYLWLYRLNNELKIFRIFKNMGLSDNIN